MIAIRQCLLGQSKRHFSGFIQVSINKCSKSFHWENNLLKNPAIAFGASTIVLGIQNSKSCFTSTTQKIESIAETAPTTMFPESTDDYKLPDYIKPISYELSLYPNLKDGTFKGEVVAIVNVTKDTNVIKIHNNGLTITSAHIDNVPAKYEINNKYELLILKRSDNNGVGKGERTIVIKYKGDMKNRIVGLYMSSYTTTNGTKRSIATSKFEPTYARQAFPCFDEPNMKAKYTVHILKPNIDGYIALSNMPEKSSTPVDDGVMVHFEESKEMSTYLSCFIVCDFKSNDDVIKPDIGDAFPLRVFSTVAQVNKTKFALEVGKSVMEYFINYFGIPYPLPKLDLIAIPDFVSGAMEHWGLVTFRETALLFDEQMGSTKNKQRVASVIAHELAHSWFGNLVTMNWWNDLWLNEGFASYIQYKGVDFKFKDWQMMDQFLVETLHSVLSTDSTPASHPIVQTVHTPDQITEIFDSITYNKGSSILRMLDFAITQDVFQKGVKNYLLAHQWGNAVTQNLWDQLQKLVPEYINITEFMNTWTVQMGYPIVTINEDTNNYVLTQKRFLKDYTKPGQVQSPYGYKWTIPITYITDKNQNPVTVWFKHDQPNLKIEKPKDIKWIKFNHNQVGFYRVNYKSQHWEELAKNIDQMSTSDKTHLLEESFSIAETGDLNYSIPLELTKYLKNESNSIPWSVASSKLGGLKKYLIDTLDYPQYPKYILTLVTPVYENLTWDEKPDDSHLTKHARTLILNLACANGHKECIKIAAEKFQLWLKKPDSVQIPQDLRRTVYYYGMKNSGADDWFKLLDIFKKEIDATEKLNLLYALSAVKEPWLLHHLIQLATIEGQDQIIRGQDYFTMLQYVSSNPIGSPIVWDYVRENWMYLVNRFGTNDRYLGRLIPAITKSFTTKTKLNEIKAFFEENPNAGAGQVARQEALANVNNNIQWVQIFYDFTKNWGTIPSENLIDITTIVRTISSTDTTVAEKQNATVRAQDQMQLFFNIF
ncbi:hypothetical protein RN001_006519 [Aquatica leii]|uniref:Aminopeptidase n=1 Tax=Aquatica leii TaxID=1421715 RepID=A0AAN7SS96_9COLE|nr:hypothetical protein RN001_006519 [Aquatica leii]